MKKSQKVKLLSKQLRKYPASLILKAVRANIAGRGYLYDNIKMSIDCLHADLLTFEATRLLEQHPITKQLRKSNILLNDVTLDADLYSVSFADRKYVEYYEATHTKPLEALFKVVSRMPPEIKNKFLV